MPINDIMISQKLEHYLGIQATEAKGFIPLT